MRRVTSARAASSEIPWRRAKRRMRCSGWQVTTINRSKRLGGVGFEDQGSFDDSDGFRIALADLFHPFVFLLDHGGMNDFVEFLDARRRAAGNAECGFGQPGPVDASVGIQDFAAEAADDFFDKPGGRDP